MAPRQSFKSWNNTRGQQRIPSSGPFLLHCFGLVLHPLYGGGRRYPRRARADPMTITSPATPAGCSRRAGGPSELTVNRPSARGVQNGWSGLGRVLYLKELLQTQFCRGLQWHQEPSGRALSQLNGTRLAVRRFNCHLKWIIPCHFTSVPTASGAELKESPRDSSIFCAPIVVVIGEPPAESVVTISV